MIITLAGDNTYAIQQAAQDFISRFINKFGAAGLEKIDAEQFEPTGLPQLLLGTSLFTPQRLVVLKNVAQNKILWQELANWVPKLPNETTLLLILPNADKRSKTYKLLKGKSDFKEFAFLSENELLKWLMEKVDVGMVEAKYLIERVGNDQWRLEQEALKLANFGQNITKQNIDQLVEASPNTSVFGLLDAALNGEVMQVSKLIEQIKTEEDPYKFLGLLVSQVHALALMATGSSGKTEEIALASGVHPFVLRKSQPIAKRLGLPKIKSIIQAVAECDARLKSTGEEPWRLLSLTLQKIAL